MKSFLMLAALLSVMSFSCFAAAQGATATETAEAPKKAKEDGKKASTPVKKGKEAKEDKEPVDSTGTELGKAKNRRVEFILQ